MIGCSDWEVEARSVKEPKGVEAVRRDPSMDRLQIRLVEQFLRS